MELDGGQLRIPLSDFDEVLREFEIEVFDGWFHFLNLGKILVSLQQFRIGGDSRPQYEIIMKTFQWLGTSERQGYGEPLIYTTTASGGVHMPEVYTDIEKTDLRIAVSNSGRKTIGSQKCSFEVVLGWKYFFFLFKKI